MCLQGFDYDFGCGESPVAKDIGRLWNEQCETGITFAGFIVGVSLFRCRASLTGPEPSCVVFDNKAPLLLRAFPILNSLLPLKIKEAQSATKMHIHRLAVDLARDAIDEARLERDHDQAHHDKTGAKEGNGILSENGHSMRLRRRKNLLSDLGECPRCLPCPRSAFRLLQHIFFHSFASERRSKAHSCLLL